jgi:WD40 repeat protein
MNKNSMKLYVVLNNISIISEEGSKRNKILEIKLEINQINQDIQIIEKNRREIGAETSWFIDVYYDKDVDSLISTSKNGDIKRWHLGEEKSFEIIKKFNAQLASVKIFLNEKGLNVAAACRDNCLYLWNKKRNQKKIFNDKKRNEFNVIGTHEDQITSIAYQDKSDNIITVVTS